MIEPPVLLVVDDNEMNRDMLARRCERQGYVVVTAGDGRQALNLLVERRFDLVLLDIEMPTMDGLAVLRLLRKTYPMTDLPVIMVTATDASQSIVNALDLGANDYVTKPIDFPVVAARVKTQLGLKRANDEVKSLAKQLEARNELIRSVFGRYVATEVVDTLLASPEALKFGGETRTVSVLFVDARGFTPLAEQLAPERIVTLLNAYLGALTNIVSKHNGIVDELLGDGIMAFFGAPSVSPDHAQRAIASAVEMQLAMETLNEQNCACGLPVLRIGIGVHTGEAVVGNIGSERRSKYSVVGRHVNLASRIQGYSAAGQILISEATLEEAGAVVRVDGRIVVQPKGADQPVTLYEVGGIGGDYNLFLAKTDTVLHPLQNQIPITYAILDETRGGQTFEGLLTDLSIKGGCIRAVTDRRRIAVHSDVKIILNGETRGGATEYLYGKVVGVPEARDKFRVHFTSMPPEMSGVLATLIQRHG